MSVVWEAQVLLKHYATHTKSYMKGGDTMIRAKLTEVRQAVADQVTNADSRKYIGLLIDNLEKVVLVALSGKPVSEEVGTGSVIEEALTGDDLNESDTTG